MLWSRHRSSLFTDRHPGVPAPFIRLSFLCGIILTSLSNWQIVIDFWAVSVPSVHLFILFPILQFLNNCSFLINLNIRAVLQFYSSFSGLFWLTRFFAFAYKILEQLVNFYKKNLLGFFMEWCWTYRSFFGKVDTKILSFTDHEHSISLHLFSVL